MYTKKITYVEFEITKDADGWLLVRLQPPFFSLRYIISEDTYQLIMISRSKLPRSFEFHLSRASHALKKHMLKEAQLAVVANCA